MGFPPGHYYSPIPDPADLLRRQAQLWAPRAAPTGVDMRVPEQLALLQQMLPHLNLVDFPVEAPKQPERYYYMNGIFPVLDAEFLFGMISLLRPARVVEVGSGYSSLVIADVNCRVLGGRMDVTCIEPYPRDFLVSGVEGITRLLTVRLEDTDPTLFEQLEPDDVLFVDSSHVAKTGSDVNFLFFDVLPRLKPGVYVHLPEIFLPDEYPREWVLEEGRSWNEQYLLHAFLQYNAAWEVVWMRTTCSVAMERLSARCSPVVRNWAVEAASGCAVADE